MRSGARNRQFLVKDTLESNARDQVLEAREALPNSVPSDD